MINIEENGSLENRGVTPFGLFETDTWRNIQN